MAREISKAADAASVFAGERLTLARHLAGLRKNALAGIVGKTPTAVASYENNIKKPSPATVAQLALALGVDPEFFHPGPPRRRERPQVPHFRSLRSTTQVSRDQAHAYLLTALDVVATLERHVDFPAVKIPEVPVPDDPNSYAEAEEAARTLREHWGVPSGPVGHLVRLAENHGIIVVFSPAQSASVDAYSLAIDGKAAVALNPLKDDYWRQRFDVAHELGHLVMHEDAEPGGQVLEEQAHRFAAEFLTPQREIGQRLPAKADWRRLAELKEEWGVSMQALLFRARYLGIMSDTTYSNAMMKVSANGWRRREPGPPRVLEQPSSLPAAIDLLASIGVTADQVRLESRTPKDKFEQIISRNPLAPVAAADRPDLDGPSNLRSVSID